MPYKSKFKQREAQLAYWRRHAEKQKKTSRDWKKANPEKVKATAAKWKFRRRVVRLWALENIKLGKPGFGYGKGQGKRKKFAKGKLYHPAVKWITCKVCETEYFILRATYRGNLRLTNEANQYCSASCASTQKFGKILRQTAWTDEQWEWEKKLADMDLSMSRGNNPNRVIYGYDPLLETKPLLPVPD
jgi:hypothetical protein